MANEVTVDPRYMKYETKGEVEEILDRADKMLVLAEEETVRGIVTGYGSDESSSSE